MVYDSEDSHSILFNNKCIDQKTLDDFADDFFNRDETNSQRLSTSFSEK